MKSLRLRLLALFTTAILVGGAMTVFAQTPTETECDGNTTANEANVSTNADSDASSQIAETANEVGEQHQSAESVDSKNGQCGANEDGEKNGGQQTTSTEKPGTNGDGNFEGDNHDNQGTPTAQTNTQGTNTSNNTNENK